MRQRMRDPGRPPRLHAIDSVERDLRTDQAAMAVAIGTGGVERAEPGALLAAAERELTGLPPQPAQPDRDLRRRSPPAPRPASAGHVMTTLTELLDDVTTRAWTDLTTGQADSEDAVRALRTASQVLDPIANRGLGADAAAEPRSDVLRSVARRCRQLVQPTDGAGRGRLSELIAAAADLINTMTPPLTDGESWAVTGALLDPMCACTAIAREHANTAEVIDLARSLDALRHWHTLHPARPADLARLDQARPTTINEEDETLAARTCRLMDEIAYRAATVNLTPSDARFVTAAALHVATYARTFQPVLDTSSSRAQAAPQPETLTYTWFTARDAIRDAEPHPQPTVFAPLVAEFSAALSQTFGPRDAPHEQTADAASTTRTTTYRSLLNRLPGLADSLARSAVRWGTIPARTQIPDVEPIPWRDHTGVQRYAAIRPTPLTATVSAAIAQAALDAARASALAAAHADASAGRVGEQPHPRLVQAHLDRVSQPKPTRDSRRDRVVSDIDHCLTTDATWPVLARVLDIAAGDGWDVTAHLRQIATDLPPAQPAAELAYRILAVHPLEPIEITEPPAAPHTSDDDNPTPPIAIIPAREPVGPSR